MKAAAGLVAVTLAVVVSGCAGTGGAEGSSDCAAQVRADGVVYTSHGYTDRRPSKHSWAEEADCDDVGADPAGSVFPESPRHVTTWRFADHPPAKVLGVRTGDTDTFAVFVADSVPPDERDRIYVDLATGSR
jgi:hypothetical protein